MWSKSDESKAGSTDAGQKNFKGQQPGSNSSDSKLQLFIYKGGIYWWEKNSQWKIAITKKLSMFKDYQPKKNA